MLNPSWYKHIAKISMEEVGSKRLEDLQIKSLSPDEWFEGEFSLVK